MNRHLITTLLFTATSLTAMAQPKLTTDSESIKLGDIMWQNPKTVSFNFTNTGSDPLVITEIRPSCGCVNVAYPQQAIPAGAQSAIQATFDAAMLGTFYRELAVYTNMGDEPLYLSFSGRVVETAVDYEDDFPIDLGNVRLSSNYVEFDNVQKGDRPVVELQVANTSSAVYAPQLMHLPQYLSAEYLPKQIQPGRSGKIRLTLESEKLFMDGLNQTSVYLARRMPDKVSDENEIVVSAILIPAFQGLTAQQMARAPHIVVMDDETLVKDETQMVMGKKQKATKTLNVTNIGEETLSISAVQVFNNAISVSLGNRNIAPHQTTKLKISVDAKLLAKAKNEPRLLIISNDPRQPKTVLNLNVE